MAVVDVISCDRTFYNEAEATAIQKLSAQKDALCAYFKERDEIIEAFFLALLSQNHIVMIGPPGTAKSYLIESFCAGISDVKLFAWQLTKFSTPEELFGPYSLTDLKAGKYTRIINDKLPTADIAYIDEVFNGNSSILNAFNSAMNERTFEGKPIPLKCVFSGTNFIPEDGVLIAFYDRFLFRFIVDEIHDAGHFGSMLMLGEYSLDPSAVITKTDLEQLQQKIGSIKFDGIIPQMVKLRESLRDDGIGPSSRRFKWAIRALQANALLNGRAEVIDEDLFVLKNVLWGEKKEIPIVEQVIAKAINPAIAEIRELLAQAKEIENDVKTADPKNPTELAKIMEALEKLKAIVDDVKTIVKSKHLSEKVKETANKICNEVTDAGKRLQQEKLKFAF